MSFKKILPITLIGLIFASIICFCFFTANGVHAAQLEVSYPNLPNNTSPPTSTDTPLDKYLKYIFDLGIFTGFVSVGMALVIAGVLFFLSPVSPGALQMARDRVSGAISGFLIFVLFYLIIVTANPYLAIFQLKPLEEIPPPPQTEKKNPGVNFYSSPDCSGTAETYISSIPDLGNLKNNLNSISISHSPEENIYYISILYDVTKYWGKCQYINPNVQCEKPDSSFPASASIHNYSFSSKGDVNIYRNSFFEQEGGYLKISSSEIGRMYVKRLSDLFFGPSRDPDNCTVPKQDQDCVKWDNKGACTQKQCPSLAEKNISSIKIEGNYIVLLVYFDENKDSAMSWSYCQEFPSADDINKEGPNQIKWADIRNRGQNPNWLIIIPVEKK
jgi:hypothetical protein